MFAKRKRIKQLKNEMASARNYENWLGAARELDQLEQRDDPRAGWYGAAAVEARTHKLRDLRLARQPLELIQYLEESLSQHHHDLTNPRLYFETYAGENQPEAVAFLEECTNAMHYLCDEHREGYPDAVKLEIFSKFYRKYGRSALLLSGGATMGIYHLGVVKALFDQGLLPRVISGSSMGAIVAAAVCTRTREELADFFGNPEQIHLSAMKVKKLRRVVAETSFFEPTQLLHHIETNIGGDYTFQEAWKKTGWDLNISVSPTRSRQKPRLLNHVTAPNLLISHSALVSCAMPFLYQPGMLMERGADGQPVPHLPEERWIDGTIGGDIPMSRISRLYNVNHYIVSQTNPYIYLFAGKSEKPTLAKMGLDIAGSAVHAQACSLLGSARKYIGGNTVGPVLDQLYHLTSQPFSGDINIQPGADLLMLRKYVTNPTPADLQKFISGGERVTWLKMAMVRDQTLISRTFEMIIDKLEKRMQDTPD